MLYTEVPVSELICKYGASTDAPTSDAGLITDESMDWTSIKSNSGWDVTITTGDSSTQAAQYAVVAVSRELQLTSWYAKSMSFIDFVSQGQVTTVEKEGYNLYYLNTKTYDVDLGGTEYILKFKEA